jgi:hypothetical protein
MIVLLLAVGVAAPAAALPVTVFFDGPSGYGVSAASAEASGVPFVYPEVVGSASGVLNVAQQLQGDYDYDDIVDFLLNESGNTATSMWTVENESDDDLPEETYLFLATAVLFSIDGEDVVYENANVGLSIDLEDGWVFVRTSTEPGEGYYYPAIKIGPLGVDEQTLPFAVNYVVDEPIHIVGLNKVVLPQLVAGMAYTTIPEPATSILLGVGLVLLAVFHRRRA